MKEREDAYRDLFLAEANENFESLNQLFIKLEKKPDDKRTIAEIFRITHTLKGNALGMGYQEIASISHVVEDIFDAVKSGRVRIDEGFIEQLFRANDKLGELILSVSSGEKVSYLGLKTKLEVLLRNSLEADPKESEKEVTPPVEDGIIESVEPQSQGQEEEGGAISFADYIQIPVRKLDEMMNLVGELLIERDKLINRFEGSLNNRSELDGLKRISSNLHYSIMNARMVQIGFLFSKFHRIARDAAAIEKKKVKLALEGTEVEVDRNILKTISEALVHLVRNAISHGIELPEERFRLNKDGEGVVRLSASLQKDNIRITISDDGKGMSVDAIRQKIVQKKLATQDQVVQMDDQQVLDHIFMTGFSSADQVTEISGRGVGMDIVKKAVESVGGQVTLDTLVGLGTQIHLTIPSSLAIKSALLFKLNDQEYAIPMAYTEAVSSIQQSDLNKMNKTLVGQYLEEIIPYVHLKTLIQNKNQATLIESGISGDTVHQSIIVSHGGKFIGLIVDQLMQQKEIVEKALPNPIKHVKLISGTSLLGNGKVCPVIDVSAIAEIIFKVQIGTIDQLSSSSDK